MKGQEVLHSLTVVPVQFHQKLASFAEERDEAGFAQVVEEFSGLVFHGAFRRVGDRELAEEVTLRSI